MKAAVAMKIFGKSGADLIPMTAELKELRKEAQELGLTMSSKDAEAAAELGDAWERLTSTVKMLFFNIGSALAPAMQKFLDKAKNRDYCRFRLDQEEPGRRHHDCNPSFWE